MEGRNVSLEDINQSHESYFRWYGEPIYFTLGNQWIEPTAMVFSVIISYEALLNF